MTRGRQVPLQQVPSSSPEDENVESRCYVCGSSDNTSRNPLIWVSDFEYEDGSTEYVHLTCAHRNSRYGFCWCCESNHELKVFMADALNDAGECSDHAGESVPDYPEADLKSYIEYIQKDE